MDSDWIGALRPTNNTGEINVIYHADTGPPLLWPGGASTSLQITASGSSGTTPSNLAATRPSFSESGAFSPLSAGVTTWPSSGAKPLRASPRPRRWGTQIADRLAEARGRTGSSGATVHSLTTPSRPHPRRSPRGPSDPRRRPQRPPLPSQILRPSHFAFYLSVPDRDISLRVAPRVCHDISPAPAVTIPSGSGDIVGE